jgi:hypothetical protein
MKGRTRWMLIGLQSATGALAAFGALALLVDAETFGVQEAWLRGSPFADYRVPALTLLLGVGGISLAGALALLERGSRVALLLSVAAGATLIGFEIAEVAWIGMRNAQQPAMFLDGCVVAGLALWAWRGR